MSGGYVEYLTLNASCNNDEINARINAKAIYQGKIKFWIVLL